MDVTTLTGLLWEAEEHHGPYEAIAPKHHWSGWYASYIVARAGGRSPDQAAPRRRPACGSGAAVNRRRNGGDMTTATPAASSLGAAALAFGFFVFFCSHGYDQGGTIPDTDRPWAFETLTVGREGAVLFADSAAPPMNLLGPRLVRDLVSLIKRAEADDAVRVLVFRSADPDYFISHVDVTRIKEYREEAAKLTGEASIALLFRHLN